MMMKPIAVAGIAVAAAAAGGVGSYLAVRHAVGPVPGAAAGTDAEPAPGFAMASPAPTPTPETAAGAVETEVAAEPPVPDPRPAARPEPRSPALRPDSPPPTSGSESSSPAARSERAAPTRSRSEPAPSSRSQPAAPSSRPEPAAPSSRSQPAAPSSRSEPAAPTRSEPAAPTRSVAAGSAPGNRASTPSAGPISPEPTTRPRPAAASATARGESSTPRGETPPEPAVGTPARANTDAPPLPGDRLPAGWTRAGGPRATPNEAEQPTADPQPPSTGTALLDARPVDVGIAPDAPDASGTAPESPTPLDARAVTPALAPGAWPAFDELEIAAESVIGIQIETAVSTRTASIEDPVEAQVVRDVLVGPRVAVPAGTRMRGSVVLVEPGGRIRSAARLGVRFHTLLTDDGAEVPLSTETIYREGNSPGSDSAAKIGGAAVAGSILGAIFGGERGAAIGGSIGAAGGTAAALNGQADPARLRPGARLTVRLSRPAFVTAPR